MDSAIVPSSQTQDLGRLAESHDLLREFVADKRSAKTKHEYTKDLRDFFTCITGSEPTPAQVNEFLQLDRFEAISLVLRYKQTLVERGLKEATVNRRLSAIKSLVNYAAKIGQCSYSLSDIKSEKVKPYRDTSGIQPESFKKLLAIPHRDTLKGQRDYALLRLLWDNALRRGEIAACNIGDLDLDSRKLWILGKGRGTSREAVSLSVTTTQALQEYLQARQETDIHQPLFVSVDPVTPGHRLTGSGIYKIVRESAAAAGITKVLSPHRIRHSSVTAALEATNGDVRRVQKLSRHANLNTLMIYDDNRLSHQGEISDLLSGLV
jgi:integrase/recombinase XerC